MIEGGIGASRREQADDLSSGRSVNEKGRLAAAFSDFYEMWA
jgi:hypothetical protein